VIHEPVLEISCGQKQCAHTHTQTDTRRWPQDLTAYGAQVIIPTVRKNLIMVFNFSKPDFLMCTEVHG